jgi:hypothetical protein
MAARLVSTIWVRFLIYVTQQPLRSTWHFFLEYKMGRLKRIQDFRHFLAIRANTCASGTDRISKQPPAMSAPKSAPVTSVLNASRMPMHQDRHISNHFPQLQFSRKQPLSMIHCAAILLSDDSQSAKPDDIIQESDVIRPSRTPKR